MDTSTFHEVSFDHGTLCIKIANKRFDYRMLRDFRDAYKTVPLSAIEEVVIELQGVDYVDSAALGGLLRLHDYLKPKGLRAHLRNCGEATHSHFTRMLFDQFFDISTSSH